MYNKFIITNLVNNIQVLSYLSSLILGLASTFPSINNIHGARKVINLFVYQGNTLRHWLDGVRQPSPARKQRPQPTAGRGWKSSPIQSTASFLRRRANALRSSFSHSLYSLRGPLRLFPSSFVTESWITLLLETEAPTQETFRPPPLPNRSTSVHPPLRQAQPLRKSCLAKAHTYLQ